MAYLTCNTVSLYVFLLLSSHSSLLPWGLHPCLLKCVPAQIQDGLCDCTAVIRMTQEKLTLLMVPTCSSLNPKYGLDPCVLRGVNTLRKVDMVLTWCAGAGMLWNILSWEFNEPHYSNESSKPVCAAAGCES